MYIKKKERELFQLIDNKVTIPSKWFKFINEQRKHHNLIIKTKKEYLCTNCKSKFKADKKINEECKCPNCKNVYLVKSDKLKKYKFKDQLAIFDKIDDYYVERIFQLESNYRNGSMSYCCFEWGRNIYGKDFDVEYQIINNNTVGTTSGVWISYRSDFNSNWKYSDSLSNPIRYIDQFIYYPYNLKKLLSKNPDYKYSQMWELVKHVSYCDLVYLLKYYNPSVELLTKLKFYNLALNPKTFMFKKSFKERFMGLSKEYFPFIRKYNLNIDELKALSLIKEKNIDIIKKVSKLSDSEELFKIINLKKALKLTDLNENNCAEYKDYLTMIKVMKFDMKNPKYLYPKNILKAHDKIENEFDIRKDALISEAIKNRFNELSKYTYEDNKYIIFPANSIESLENESSQQHNCVRTYAERISKGSCDIYFMRLTKDRDKSLVTVEVKNSEVVQKRTKNNNITTEEQNRFLNIWEKKILRRQV